jgi:hypothetical protein
VKSFDELAKAAPTNASLWLSSHGFELNSREWASLVWLGIVLIVLVFAAPKSQLRASFWTVFRSAFATKLTIVWIIYATWIVILVALADWANIWKAVLTKDTVIWTVTAGLALLTGFTEASEPGYFRRAVLKAVSVVAILEYLVTLAIFSLWTELLLQPVVFLFAVAPIVAREPEQRTSWQYISTRFFAVFGLVLLAHTARTLWASWGSIDWKLSTLQALWPIALALWVLMLVFALAVVASYEQAFLRLNRSRGGKAGTWKGKLGLVLALGLRPGWIHEAAKGGTFHVARANSIRDALEAARRFKAERIAERRLEDAYQTDLVRYTGSSELDDQGRPTRDKREFRETVRALEWLHTCQMGWYRRSPVGYKPDLIEHFSDDFTTQGLPIPSGITMNVANDGERWYAWRQTPGGHYFAIGASEGPPNQWLYDGPEPPRNFPGIGVEWGEAPYLGDHARNWYR